MSLPWIKLSHDVPAHPKSDALEIVLGVRRAWTHVVELWLWASQYRPTGDLSGLPAAVIARRAGWEGDAKAFVDAIIETGWLDDEMRIHDWDRHQGAHRAKVERDREAWRERKKRQRTKTDVTRDMSVTSAGQSDEGHACPAGPRAEEREGERDRELDPPLPPLQPSTVETSPEPPQPVGFESIKRGDIDRVSMSDIRANRKFSEPIWRALAEARGQPAATYMQAAHGAFCAAVEAGTPISRIAQAAEVLGKDNWWMGREPTSAYKQGGKPPLLVKAWDHLLRGVEDLLGDVTQAQPDSEDWYPADIYTRDDWDRLPDYLKKAFRDERSKAAANG